MCEIADIIVAVLLIMAAYRDWKTKQISLWLLIVAAFVIILLRCIAVSDTVWSTLGGIIVGLCFFLISKFTREAIGYGDSWLIMLLGIYLGGKCLLELMFVASFCASLFSISYGMVRGWNRKKTIPFVPFLSVAYLGVVFL